jgi:hypothetical protein
MSYKTENVNVAFEMITQAVEEFSGFVLGIPEGNVVNQILGVESTEGRDIVQLAAERQIRKLLSSICDRTNGGTSLFEIGLVNRNAWKKSILTQREKIISVLHNGSEIYDIPDSEILGNSEQIAELNARSSQTSGIKHILKYKTGASPLVISRAAISGSESSRNVAVSELDEAFQFPPDALNKNVAVGTLAGFSKESPSLGAVVLKDPKFGINSRNAGHMPVFLSAVSPIEMSRCTPYLDVKIVTNKKNKPYSKLGIFNFLRITDEATAESPLSKTFSNPSPGAEIENVTPDSYYSYMNLFTSPQTLVNANINKKWGSQKLGDFLEDKFTPGNLGDFEYSDVKDPFQPFLTLLDFSVSISGIGHGLLATKKAYLKLKLHDKSRIKDLEDLLSPTQFAATKFIIEFGWSHPDGAVDSTNTIGKYLNSLRDAGVYQLVSADYSFGADSSVDITINMVCAGFNQMKSVSAAGGVVTGLDTIIDDVENTIDNYLKEIEPDAKTPKLKEIRGDLKISHSDLLKNSIFINFDELSEFKKSALLFLQENIRKDFADEFFSNLLKMIFGKSVDPTILEDGNVEKLKELLSSSSKISAGEIIYSKAKSLPGTADPFVGQVAAAYYDKVSGQVITDVPLIGISEKYKSTPDHISLGKIASMFIGYPMATCGLYDEVQLFFYPVNTQSAAARRHTTASLPIYLPDLLAEFDKRILASEQSFKDLSVQSFFTMLERIVSNQRASLYGLFSVGDKSPLEEFQKKEFKDKLAEAKAELDATGRTEEAAGGDQEISPDLKEEQIQKLRDQNIINFYESDLAKKLKAQIDKRLSEAYLNDGLKDIMTVDDTRFTPINLSMYFETFPVRKVNSISDASDVFETFKNTFANTLDRRGVEDNGVIYDKTVLRIHIYDENSSMNPDINLFGTDSKLDPSNTGDYNTDLQKLAEASYASTKNLLMQYHPSIIHGASSGVVNSISVSSNTTGQLSNILIVEAYGQIRDGENSSDQTELFDETVLLPTSVQIEMMGFPGLARGQQIFIDFGTQTSLDNLYTVKTVDHSVSQGVFKTSSTLVATNQMIVKSYKSRINKLIEKATSKTT